MSDKRLEDLSDEDRSIILELIDDGYTSGIMESSNGNRLAWDVSFIIYEDDGED